MQIAIPGTLMLIGLVAFAAHELFKQYVTRALEPPPETPEQPWTLDHEDLRYATGPHRQERKTG